MNAERGRAATPASRRRKHAGGTGGAAPASGGASPGKRRKKTTGTVNSTGSSGRNRGRQEQQQQRKQDRRGGASGRDRDRNNRKGGRVNNVRPIFERACSSISSISAASAATDDGKRPLSSSKSRVAFPTLSWKASPHAHHPVVEAEEALLPQLLKYGKKERGMFRTKPSWLVEKVEQLCHYNSIDLIQALSLRRTHMKLLNPGMDMSKLHLGSNDNVRTSAALFEEAVEDYLHSQDVPFMTEEEQKAAHKQKNGTYAKTPPTPDFFFPQLTRLRYTTACDDGAADSSPLISFIEVKMFYGAGTIPDESPNAVGLIMPKLKRYVELYGPGAIVFSFGCSERLAKKLASIGVVALDAGPLDLTQMEEHQRSWCANDSGRILP